MIKDSNYKVQFMHMQVEGVVTYLVIQGTQSKKLTATNDLENNRDIKVMADKLGLRIDFIETLVKKLGGRINTEDGFIYFDRTNSVNCCTFCSMLNHTYKQMCFYINN